MQSMALLTDLYQLTMANGYFKLGIHNKQACFHHFFRRTPFHGEYAIAGGLAIALAFLESFRFSKEDIAYLSSLNLFDSEFLKYLSELVLEVEIEAVAEGSAIFPREPLLRVRGPLLQCQILETVLLNIVNFQTLIATKASRCVHAARGREVVEFGLRRAQGPDGALSAARAAFVGGCTSTSNVLAGKEFGIPVRGTQAHSWIMAFGDELAAFRAFAQAMPNSVVLLVDTYHTIEGVKNAIIVGKELEQKGKRLLGIRLDSGNLTELSKKSRALLDEAGLRQTKIMVSGDLDEYAIDALVRTGAPIDAFGVGTRLSTAFDEPALGGVYKLAGIEGADGSFKPCLKISDDADKITLPGLLQTRRLEQGDKFVKDIIYNDDDKAVSLPPGKDLLELVFKGGKRTRAPKSLRETQEDTFTTLSRLDESHLLLKDARTYNVQVEGRLHQRQARLAKGEDA